MLLGPKTNEGMYYSAVSLFSAITGGNDWMSYGENLIRLDEASHIYFLLFIFYIGFCLVGMLNVVTGIFVDSAVCTRISALCFVWFLQGMRK